MSTKKYGNIAIVGDDFSWIEETKESLSQPSKLDENVQILLRLRKCMKERGWSQKKLAATLGVSPQYINKLLRNQDSTFSVKVAAEYGEKLNYPLIKVCSDNDDVKAKFVRMPTLLVNDEYRAADFWQILDHNSYGFIFPSEPLSKKKNINYKFQPSYA